MMKLSVSSKLLFTYISISLFLPSQWLSAANDNQALSNNLSLKQIMADPDWMGASPQDFAWSRDGQAVLYTQKAMGHGHKRQMIIELSQSAVKPVSPEDRLWFEAQSANLNQAKTQGVFTYQGDLYWVDFASKQVKGLIQDNKTQSNAQFVNENQVSFLEGHSIFIYNLNNGSINQIAEFKLSQDPEREKEQSYLEKSQPRLIEYINKTTQEKEFQKQRKRDILERTTKTWYLGKNVSIKTFRLSPNAQWLILGTTPKSRSGKSDHMPEFVTADGYVNDRKVRPLVGTSEPTQETFYLFDLKAHKKHALKTSKLPGISDDPLAKIKKMTAKRTKQKFVENESPRAVYAHNWTANGGVEWTKDSTKAALILYSYDNKDRWIVGVDVGKPELKTLHWMSDEAWINDWTFNQFGWLPDNNTLYYLSEEDGYSHLYIKTGKRRPRQLTEGSYEVSDVTVSADGNHFYFKANKKHPGIYEIYQVAKKGGQVKALTNLGGVNDYVLSPDEQSLLIRHSTTTKMPELLHATLDSSVSPKQLTSTASSEFKSIDWQAPEIVAVPSSHVNKPIYSRYYAARSAAKTSAEGKKPAVMFVHGAGYLQNSHQGWSGYFREFMFHNMLTQMGYVVLDMDYRASKGYGRDWRTAIYRQMGTPELQDMQDGVKWLVENANVDPKRVGVYGGSYGGFMTFMALFKSPETFAAGASLRPVTDWAHYNHGYTSNILNTPEVDPIAYERSSPIEFAEGLNKPLLICHGMVDDNVFFKDTVRLVQRLIELEKTEYFETAIYPVEPHGFVQPSSWLDEYTRIFNLFEEHLNP
ncbi:prolyl oligopeptidase family serine peptidase [Aliikangiella sp. IMCC44632]